MKRTWIITFGLVLVATAAHAGVLQVIGGAAQSVFGWALENALAALIAMFFMVIAGFFGGTVWGKFLLRARVPITELKDVAVQIHKARRPDSPGGKTMTPEELQAILKECEDVVTAVIVAFGATAQKK